jgi:hypothetical protein
MSKEKKKQKKKRLRLSAYLSNLFNFSNSVKLTIKAPSKKVRPKKNTMSFREKLLLANTEKLRSTKNVGL